MHGVSDMLKYANLSVQLKPIVLPCVCLCVCVRVSECVRMFGRRAGVFKEQVCQKKQSVKGSYVKSCQNSFF